MPSDVGLSITLEGNMHDDPPITYSARSHRRNGAARATCTCNLTLPLNGAQMASSKQAATDSHDALRDEIEELEARLGAARARLRAAACDAPSAAGVAADPSTPETRVVTGPDAAPSATSATHFLLLLSDSALPVGAFAFSSGLESYLAHAPRGAAFSSFLPLSLSSFGASALPFVLAAHRDPRALPGLDDELDAAVVCAVGRRASVAQGRALLGIWERSFRPALPGGAGARVLGDFAARLKDGAGDDVPLVSAHLAPLFGAVCAVAGLGLRQTAYVFLLGHVKALISAAVRASVFGPYQAQRVLAGEQVQRMIDAVIDREWNTPVEEAGQSVPVMDLWIGRHELLYSRIFNS